MVRSTFLTVITFHFVVLVQSECNIQLDLTMFRCTRQKLTEIPSHIHKNTIDLDLSHNLIEILHEDSFSRLPVIQRLTLGNNRIYKITERAFLPIANNLTFLDLHNNQLVSSITILFPISAFAPLVNVKQLDLSGNPLGYLPTGFLRYMGSNLNRLDLSSLAIGIRIESGAFHGLSRVHYLNLAYNTFSELIEESLTGLRPEHFSYLNLDGVHWHCDCRILWLRRWLNRVPTKALQITKKPGGECVTPRNFKGQALKWLNFTSLQCEPRILNTIPPRNELDLHSPIHVIGFEGQNLTIMCAFISEPKMNVNWYHEGVLIQPHWARITQTISPGTKFTTSLHFHGLKTDKHTGHYQCQASNQKGQASASFRLEISPGAIGSTSQTVKHGTTRQDFGDYFGRIVLLIGSIVIANIGLALVGFITYKCVKKRRYNALIKQTCPDHFDRNKQCEEAVCLRPQHFPNTPDTYKHVQPEPIHSLNRRELNDGIKYPSQLRSNQTYPTMSGEGLLSRHDGLETPITKPKFQTPVSLTRFFEPNRYDYGDVPLVHRTPSVQSSDMGYPGSGSSQAAGSVIGLTKDLTKSLPNKQYYMLSLRSNNQAPELVYSSARTQSDLDRDFYDATTKSLDIFDEIRLMQEKLGTKSSSSPSQSSQLNNTCPSCPVHGNQTHQKHDFSCALHSQLTSPDVCPVHGRSRSPSDPTRSGRSTTSAIEPVPRPKRRHSMLNGLGSNWPFNNSCNESYLKKPNTIPRSVVQNSIGTR